MNELEVFDDPLPGDTQQGHRSVQMASIVPSEKRLIAMLVVLLGGGTGFGGGWAGMQAAQAQTDAKVTTNTVSIEKIELETKAAIKDSELRVMEKVRELKKTVDDNFTSQESINREILRALGRVEGELKTIKR